MKKITLSIVGIILLSTLCCSYNDKYNDNANGVYQAKAESLIAFSQKELVDHLTTPNVNENNFRLTMQYWQETTYVNESNYNFTNRNVSNTVWANNYVNVLKNLSLAKQITNDYVPLVTELSTWPTKKKNRLAIIDMMMVFTFQNLVDTYGDIPYTQALLSAEVKTPKYDSASSIYSDLITKLNTDLANLTVVSSTYDGDFSTSDLFYSGDISKWKKFGNSLLLKLGITLADVNPTLAQSTVNAAKAGGVFTSQSDSCTFKYVMASSYYNPIYGELVASGRQDFIGASTLIDYMNSLTDNRIGKYFSVSPATGTYIGGIVGAPNEFGDFSPAGAFGYSGTTPGIVLGYTEVAFYLLEAEARWGSVATATAAYNTAVTSSFSEWAASGAASYIAAKPYDSSNWKKSVGEQAWVAMYNQPYVSWNFYKRLDYPLLVAPPTAIVNANGKVPVRLQYPNREQTSNASNYNEASAAIGGDRLYTKVFWDKF